MGNKEKYNKCRRELDIINNMMKKSVAPTKQNVKEDKHVTTVKENKREVKQVQIEEKSILKPKPKQGPNRKKSLNWNFFSTFMKEGR